MSLVRHTFYNLAGVIGSLLIALVTVPLYLARIGTVRYGILAIIWMILGYFGLFNLGLSRATTNRMAQLTDGREREKVFWTSLVLNAVLGLLGGGLLYGLGYLLIGPVFTLKPNLVHEIRIALPYLAFGVPLSLITSVFSGALTSLERFGTLNLLGLVGSLFVNVAPLIAAYVWSPSLTILIPVTVAARFLSALFFIPPLIRALDLRWTPHVDGSESRRLLHYGFWVTLSDIVNPFLTTIDRLLIGVVAGASAVTYYVIPANITGRGNILAGALSGALFPRLSRSGRDASQDTSIRAVLALNSLMTPLILVGIFLIHPFLALWINPAFAVRAAPVGEILLLGIWVNSLAYIPYGLLQAQGRPDLTARFHLLEVIPYLALLWAGLVEFGLPGVALAWVLRVGTDAALLFSFSGLRVRPVLTRMGLSFFLIAGGGLLRVLLPPGTLLEALVEGAWVFLAIACSLMTSEWLRATLKALPANLRIVLQSLRTAG